MKLSWNSSLAGYSASSIRCSPPNEDFTYYVKGEGLCYHALLRSSIGITDLFGTFNSPEEGREACQRFEDGDDLPSGEPSASFLLEWLDLEGFDVLSRILNGEVSFYLCRGKEWVVSTKAPTYEDALRDVFLKIGKDSWYTGLRGVD